VLQAVAILPRRLGRALVRWCLYPVFSVAVVFLAVVLFPAAGIWARWDRWRTRRQLLRLAKGRGVLQ